jgi:hypothetical protein
VVLRVVVMVVAAGAAAAAMVVMRVMGLLMWVEMTGMGVVVVMMTMSLGGLLQPGEGGRRLSSKEGRN